MALVSPSLFRNSGVGSVNQNLGSTTLWNTVLHPSMALRKVSPEDVTKKSQRQILQQSAAGLRRSTRTLRPSDQQPRCVAAHEPASVSTVVG
jgi:hypothetical protein